MLGKPYGDSGSIRGHNFRQTSSVVDPEILSQCSKWKSVNNSSLRRGKGGLRSPLHWMQPKLEEDEERGLDTSSELVARNYNKFESVDYFVS
jgi:hypothetical protein